MAQPKDDRKILVRNRKARHDFDLDTILECGMSLVGSEVKSLRDAEASLIDAYAEIRRGELWLINAQINPYPQANQFNHEPRRERKLLAHKTEIKRFALKVRDKGFTLVPLEIYVKSGKIKIEIALAKGKREFEKRQSKRTDEARRELEDV